VDFLQVINDLITNLEESPKVPVFGRRLLDEETVLEMLDRIKANLPDEFIQAQRIIEQREQIISEAKLEGEGIIKENEALGNRLAGENEITKKAQALADQLIMEAKKVAGETVNGANAYADSVLEKLEESMLNNLQMIKKSRGKLNAMRREAHS